MVDRFGMRTLWLQRLPLCRKMRLKQLFCRHAALAFCAVITITFCAFNYRLNVDNEADARPRVFYDSSKTRNESRRAGYGLFLLLDPDPSSYVTHAKRVVDYEFGCSGCEQVSN